MDQRDTGYAALVIIDNGGEYRVPIDQYDTLLAAWMRGEPFLRTTGYFGDALVIKASRVEAVNRYTADALRVRREHDARERAEDAITGEP